jgi:uncharacterized protein (DUF885 family)
MPTYARKFAFAAMNTPGPFEPPNANQAYYWVTPTEPEWSDEQVENHMKFFNKGFFEVVTIHEAWPGHYLQLLYNNTSESDISKTLAYSITMIEGWAHYCEEMIYESGYEPGIIDRDTLHAGQLIGALVRNVRYISAVKMHCQGMTVEESKHMFMEKAFMPEGPAQVEANRGTINPMYLNYTLGKLLIKKLREDYHHEKGDNFSLKDFHDELLRYGSPPIAVVRSVMLEHDSGELL